MKKKPRTLLEGFNKRMAAEFSNVHIETIVFATALPSSWDHLQWGPGTVSLCP